MNRVGPILQPQLTVVIFDPQEDLNNMCNICFQNKPYRLISTCNCKLKYHQSCLLKYIKHAMSQMGYSIELSKIKCKNCNKTFKVHFTQVQICTCVNYWNKLKNNCCEKFTVSFIIMLIIFILIITLAIIFNRRQKPQNNYYLVSIVLFIGGSVVGGFFTILIPCFCFKQLIITKIILHSISQWDEIINSGDSNLSQENVVLSQHHQIIIDQNQQNT